MTKPGRIETSRRVRAACALDTVPLLAARVADLLSWGRRMTIAHRWLDSDAAVELTVGLVVDHRQGDRAVRLAVREQVHACFGVRLAPGASNGFGFGAYDCDDNATEAAVWKRYHAGGRREVTIVELTGGGAADAGPSMDDRLVIRYWNERGAGREWAVGFDSGAYYEAWEMRDERARRLAGDGCPSARYCRQLAQEGPYRVRCGYPLDVLDTCRAGDHVAVDSDGGLTRDMRKRS